MFRCPTRWIFSRLKRTLLLFCLLSVIFAIVFGLIFIFHSERVQQLANLVPTGKDKNIHSGIVQYFPDNQNKYLFRKELTTPGIAPEGPGNVGGYQEQVKHSLLGEERPHQSEALSNDTILSYDVHAFYYAWYASQAYDGQYMHWNHKYLPSWNTKDSKTYPTGEHDPTQDDIGSNFFPLLGCYSSRAPEVLAEHMRQVRSSGSGVIVVSWYPPGMADENGPPSDEAIPALLDAALAQGVKLALHVEPYNGLNVTNLRKNLEYVRENYWHHPAFYKRRMGRKEVPVFYLYDSYRIGSSEWQRLLSHQGDVTVRGTDLDAIYLGLLVEFRHRGDIKKSKFDGFYTYFAANGFSHGSSWKNWKSLQDFAQRNSLLFVPSVGPGYVDVRIRPWNSQTTQERRNGAYYGMSWRTALSVGAKMISITSFNEWGEGTQIEPAIPKMTKDGTFDYLSYLPNEPDFYLRATRHWIDKFIASF